MLLRVPDEDIVGRDLAPEGEGVGGQEVVGRGGVEVDAHLVVGEVGGGPELIDGLLDAPAGKQVVGRSGGLVGPEKAGGDAADASLRYSISTPTLRLRERRMARKPRVWEMLI